jgi:hypothetical protein
MKKHPPFSLVIAAFILTVVISRLSTASAGPSSSHFELKSYGFGSGGVASGSSTTFHLFGLSGENGGQNAGGSTKRLLGGQGGTMQAAVPPAPTFSNPGSTYDRLHLTINPGSNPSDAKYAVAITDDNWLTTRYIQDDLTIGTVLGSEDFLPYGSWGGALGTDITQLSRLTTYKVRVAAERGNFTQSGWGAESTAATVDPSLSFGVSSSSVTFDPLTPENGHTDSTKQTIITTSTNAYHGYTVFGHATSPLSYQSYTIPDYGSPNSAPTVWSGTGFGYTTSDASLTGGTPDRFTAGGPKYAGFVTTAPGDPVAGHQSLVSGTPITDESHTISYRVTASDSQVAGEYKTTLIYIVVPTY